MTPWFRLTLVCCVLLGLLLGLTQAADWNYQPIVSSGSSFDRGTKATSDSSTSSVVGSMAFHLARAGPFRSLVLDCGLAVGNNDPPGQESHGPPGTDGALASCRPRPATQIHAISKLVHEITGFQPKN